MQLFRSLLWCIIFSVYGYHIQAQPSVLYDAAQLKLKSFIAKYPKTQKWEIAAIRITGNKVTKNYIVKRELPFKEGSEISSESIINVFDQARYNLLNTNLFLEAVTLIDSVSEQAMYIHILLKERWYIFPLPYIKLIDRNVNQWLDEQKADLNRINYGIKFTWENFTGRRDQLRLNIINGYSQEFKIYYENPYSGKKMEHGYSFGAAYFLQRQLTYGTERNKQLFYPTVVNTEIPFVRKGYQYEVGYTYRKGVNFRHGLRVRYQEEEIADTIRMLLAPRLDSLRPYFPDNRGYVSFWQADYSFQYLNLNNNAYPWKGTAFAASLVHRGFGLSSLHLWGINARVAKYIPFKKKYSLGFSGFGLLSLPFDQPMYNISFLGAGDVFMRGLEYYVIECLAGGILKTTLRRELMHFNIPTFLTKSDKYRKLPFKVVTKMFSDLGVAHYPYPNQGVLNNALLYTWGLGLDVIGYYDFIAQIDWSVNHLGQNGLFLHLRQEF